MDALNDPRLDRRDFLKAGCCAAAAALSPWTLASAFGAPRGKTKHVVVIAFAGGVRSKETIGMPQNVPNLMRLANRGVVLPNVKAENVGHYGAALSIFTGNTEIFGIRENARSTNPTIFEYLRKGGNASANSVWLSTTGGDQQVNFAFGMHPKYGNRYAASLIAPEGLFNAEFKDILDSFGRPKTQSAAEVKEIDRLAASLSGGPLKAKDVANAADVRTQQRNVEEFILKEITGQTTDLTGPGASDAKAVRIATNILRVFKPTLIGVALQQADAAHNSFNGYVEIIRRNDAEVGAMLNAIDLDPELRDSTAVLVLPEFGRDRDLNERNGLDHGDGSEELGKVALVAAGPDFKSGRTVKDTVRTIDICPTVAHLLGVETPYATGKVIRSLLA
jgi:uncharacterized protein (DUF1501 family)